MKKVNRFFKDLYGYCDWSKDNAVDLEILEKVKQVEEYIPLEDEEFLFTSPCVRYRSLITATLDWICVTNKRIVLVKNDFQTKQYKQSNYFYPPITVIDTNSLTRFKKTRLYTLPPGTGILIRGTFIIGNHPFDYDYAKQKQERILISKNQQDFKFFQQAIKPFGLELDDPRLNID